MNNHRTKTPVSFTCWSLPPLFHGHKRVCYTGIQTILDHSSLLQELRPMIQTYFQGTSFYNAFIGTWPSSTMRVIFAVAYSRDALPRTRRGEGRVTRYVEVIHFRRTIHGTFFNFVAASLVRIAVSYLIGQASPRVARCSNSQSGINAAALAVVRKPTSAGCSGGTDWHWS
jgi:hypothetical protein